MARGRGGGRAKKEGRQINFKKKPTFMKIQRTWFLSKFKKFYKVIRKFIIGGPGVAPVAVRLASWRAAARAPPPPKGANWLIADRIKGPSVQFKWKVAVFRSCDIDEQRSSIISSDEKCATLRSNVVLLFDVFYLWIELGEMPKQSIWKKLNDLGSNCVLKCLMRFKFSILKSISS